MTSNQPVKGHFDRIANLYDSFKSRNRIYYSTLKHAIKNEVGNNARIIDIGCGTGSVLNFLHPTNGVGTDLSPNMIKIANKKYKHNSHLIFTVHDIEKKPYKGSFDYILFTDVIEHVHNKNKAIKNLSKMMNTKTILILSMANPFWEPFLMAMETLKLKMPEGPHLRISEKTLLVFLNKYGLRVISKKTYMPHLSLPLVKNAGLIFVYAIKKIN